MGGCFGDSPIDRWIESQVDEHCADHKRRLTPRERQRLDDMGLDESDILEDMLDELEDE